MAPEVVKRTCDQGDPHVRWGALVKSDVDGVTTAVRPILLIDGEAGLGKALVQVGRDVDLDAHLLRELRALRITTRNEYASIGKQLSSSISHPRLSMFLCRQHTVASEWYRRGTMVVFRIEIREPTG